MLANGPATNRQIGEAAVSEGIIVSAIPAKSAHAAMMGLMRYGQANKDENGFWHLTEKGKEAAGAQ